MRLNVREDSEFEAAVEVFADMVAHARGHQRLRGGPFSIRVSHVAKGHGHLTKKAREKTALSLVIAGVRNKACCKGVHSPTLHLRS